MTASLVAPGRTYRIVQSGGIVTERETMRCPYCPKRGTCNACLGSGRILLNDGLHWTVPVVAVQPSGECAGQDSPPSPAVPAPLPWRPISVAPRQSAPCTDDGEDAAKTHAPNTLECA